MKTPRKLKCDVSNNLPYKFLEKKQNKNKFESEYDTNPQTAVAETKHTITTDTNKSIHKKRISKPLPNSFQNPLSRRGENRRAQTEDLSRYPYNQTQKTKKRKKKKHKPRPMKDEQVLQRQKHQ